MKKWLLSLIMVCFFLSVSAGEEQTIKIFAIGNSFTCDAVEQYLWEIFDEAGYDAVIANCYIGGCTLEKHWKLENSPLRSERNSCSYRKVAGGVRTVTDSVSIAFCLKDENWDYVVFQQGQGLYGIVESHYPYLDFFLGYVAAFLPSGSYKTAYQLNWALPCNSTSKRFEKYDNDQMKMYHACVDCAFALQQRSSLDLVIPTGTAIQNGRSTLLGDTFNRDWGHLDYNHGRYTASLTWFEAITGIDATSVKYRPSSVDESTAAICRKAAHTAVLNPKEITR